MADELTPGGPLVDQTLHGYAEGHRLITGSLKLAPADARAMLVLSDASGSGSDDLGEGYLTGYPIPSIGKYVLARTWPAPEMSRPGCVWTHSLLIDFADLATMSNARGLLALFKRPHAGLENYESRLRVFPLTPVQTTRVSRASGLLNALYKHPAKKIEMRLRFEYEDEELVLAAWFQQWPRLRRSFRFCTSVGIDRSLPNEPFDLQLTSATGRQQRSTIPGGILVEDEPISPELLPALSDMLEHDGGTLRDFLRRVAGDVSRGRSAMVPLCRLYSALEFGSEDPSHFDVALDTLEALGPGQARAARALLLDRVLSSLEIASDRALNFAIDSITSSSSGLEGNDLTSIGVVLWKRTPLRFASALEDDGPLGVLALRLIESLSPAALLEGVAKEPVIGRRIALHRPDLLAMGKFWAISGLDACDILETASLDRLDVRAVLAALLTSDLSRLSGIVVRRFGAAAVLEVAADAEREGKLESSEIWMASVAHRPGDLGRLLASGAIPRRLVVDISLAMAPDDLPNEYGDDPWAISALAEGSLSQAVEIRFAAFLLVRALGRRSRSCARLFLISFSKVHKGLAEGVMPEEAWDLIEQRIGTTYSWLAWDRCRRVREAVVEKFVEHELEPLDFAQLTDDPEVASELVSAAETTWRGRRYLERVANHPMAKPSAMDRALAGYLKNSYY